MCLSFVSICPPFSVQGKPVILAQEGPVDGQVRCIAAGYPVPKISWYFCELPHTRYASNILHLILYLLNEIAYIRIRLER